MLGGYYAMVELVVGAKPSRPYTLEALTPAEVVILEKDALAGVLDAETKARLVIRCLGQCVPGPVRNAARSRRAWASA